MKQASRYNKGFTILELVVTVALLSVGMVGLYLAFLPTLKNNYAVDSKLRAIYLAQEGIEIIKNIRDTNTLKMIDWSSGLLACQNGCQADYKTGTLAETLANQLKPYDNNVFLKINQDGFYGYDEGQETIFKRKIIITQAENGEALKVDVQVFWTYANQPLVYETIGYLYNK